MFPYIFFLSLYKFVVYFVSFLNFYYHIKSVFMGHVTRYVYTFVSILFKSTSFVNYPKYSNSTSHGILLKRCTHLLKNQNAITFIYIYIFFWPEWNLIQVLLVRSAYLYSLKWDIPTHTPRHRHCHRHTNKSARKWQWHIQHSNIEYHNQIYIDISSEYREMR